MQAPLDCTSHDDLEEFLIDAITSGIVVGTIDQRARVRVMWVLIRCCCRLVVCVATIERASCGCVGLSCFCQQTLHVTSCMARHVHKDDIGKILGQLSQWVQLSKGIMSQVRGPLDLPIVFGMPFNFADERWEGASD